MSKLKQLSSRFSARSHAHYAWLVPLLAGLPLVLGATACVDSGVIGDDCPASEDCAAAGSPGTGASAGSSSEAGSSSSGTGSGGSSSAGGTGSVGGTDSVGGTGSAGASGGETCGGIVPADCNKDWYCDFPLTAQCGAGDQTGTCVPKPEACDLVYSPVCGCDGKTYGNDCAAASAGVSVASKGECDAGGDTCGGRSGGTCATNEYCYYTPAAICGRADATGTCTKLQTDVGCISLYDPVCGCDGKTYGNDCEAARAGTSVSSEGECAPTGETCGGLVGALCDDGYFCDYPSNMACGSADGQGTCKAIPAGCTKELNPVCGCDGKPYGNPCQANAAGTAVASQGTCK